MEGKHRACDRDFGSLAASIGYMPSLSGIASKALSRSVSLYHFVTSIGRNNHGLRKAQAQGDPAEGERRNG